MKAAAFHRREAAEALKARNIPAQGKRAESVRRPGCNGDYIRVPRPLWPQSAKLTGAKGAMELTCIPGGDVGGMPGIRYQSLTDYRFFLPSRIPAFRPRRIVEDGVDYCFLVFPFVGTVTRGPLQ